MSDEEKAAVEVLRADVERAVDVDAGLKQILPEVYPDYVMAKPIADESWVHAERFRRHLAALRYAQTRGIAIGPLSKIEPEEAVMLFSIMLRGWEKAGEDQ